VEARWQAGRLLWAAVGMGVNVRPPDAGLEAVGLAAAATRVDVLADLIPALRAAAAERGALTSGELAQFAARDIARGRRCREPGPGLVEGIAATGELLVSHQGATRTYRVGSLVLDDPPGGS
jgi:biotin-(acetyl-CoA carboxylase) ligase